MIRTILRSNIVITSCRLFGQTEPCNRLRLSKTSCEFY